MAKLKNMEWAGRSLTLPVIGTVDFDKEGCVKVSDEDYEAVMSRNEAMGYPFGKPDEEESDAVDEIIPEAKESEEEVITPTDEEESSEYEEEPEKPSLADQLSGAKMDELKSLAIDSEYPESEWKGIKKKSELVEYLVSKLEE